MTIPVMMSGSNAPSLALDFASGNAIDSRMTTTRAAGGATYFDSTGTMQLAAANTPRIDYGPIPGTFNFLAWSNDLTGAHTTGSSYTAAFDAIGLDGQVSATTLTISLAANSVRHTVTNITPGASYIFSFYAKRGTATDAKYSVFNATGGADIVAPTSYYSQINASGFTRVLVPFVAPAGCVSVLVYVERDNGATGTIIVTGAQLELSSSAGPLVVTTGAAAGNFVVNWFPNNHFAVTGVQGTNTAAASTDITQLIAGQIVTKHTANDAANQYIGFVGSGMSSVPAGSPFTCSAYVWIPASVTTAQFIFTVEAAVSPITNINMSLRNQWQRVSVSGTTPMTGPLGGNMMVKRSSAFVTSESIYSTCWQIETSGAMGSFVPTTGAVATLNTVAQGLLAEESRVNNIRNPRAEQATVTDGTQLVTNGNFAANAVNASANTLSNGWLWYTAGGTSFVAWGAGAISYTPDGTNYVRMQTTITTVVGRKYNLTLDVGFAALNLLIGTAAGLGDNLNATSAIASNQSYMFTATATTTFVEIGRTTAGSATLANVGVKWVGIMPTNWTIDPGISGLAPSVVGTGTENGIGYVDVRFSGTSFNGDFIRAIFDSGPVTIAQNQTWAMSAYVRLIAGSLTGLNNGILQGQDNASGNPTFATGIAPTSAPLALQRYGGAFTLTTTGTAMSGLKLQFSTTNTTAIDVTLRVGLAQFEQGTFVTSAILPAIASPAVTTRGVESSSIAAASFFNPAASTVQITFQRETALAATGGGGNAGVVAITDGAGANFVNYYDVWNGGRLEVSTYLGSAVIAAALPLKDTLTHKIAITTAAAGSAAICNDGGTVTTASPAAYTPPLATPKINIGADRNGNAVLGGWVKSVRYWPRALAAPELITATT